MPPPWTNVQAIAALRFTGAGLPTEAVSTMGFFFLDDPADVLDAWQLFWDELKPVISQQVTLADITVKRGPSDTGPTYIRAVNEAGTLAGTITDPQVSVLVRKTVEGVSGRLGGRMYLPPPTENQTVAGGQLGPTFLASYQQHVDDAHAAWLAATQDSPFYVLSNNSSDPREVTSLEVQAQVATQRRRNRR